MWNDVQAAIAKELPTDAAELAEAAAVIASADQDGDGKLDAAEVVASGLVLAD